MYALALAASLFTFYVFDNGIGRGKLPLEEQAELARKTGYAGVGFSGVKNVPEMLAALEARGLKMYSLYLVAQIGGGPPYYDPGLMEAMRQLRGRDTLILLGVNGTAPDAEERAVRVVGEVADGAAENGLRVALYPHYGFHIARVEEALRIRQKAGRKNVGVSFNLCHWLRAGDGANLELRLRQAMPHLLVVSINGADPEGDWDRLIQPLDRGSYDVYGFLRALERAGFRGPVALQCYNVKGDLEENLSRSMRAWKGFAARRAGAR